MHQGIIMRSSARHSSWPSCSSSKANMFSSGLCSARVGTATRGEASSLKLSCFELYTNPRHALSCQKRDVKQPSRLSAIRKVADTNEPISHRLGEDVVLMEQTIAVSSDTSQDQTQGWEQVAPSMLHGQAISHPHNSQTNPESAASASTAAAASATAAAAAVAAAAAAAATAESPESFHTPHAPFPATSTVELLIRPARRAQAGRGEGKPQKRRQCAEPGCTTRPNYNAEGTKKGLYCASHKKPDMVDVLNQRCLASGCMKQPTYNTVGSLKGLYCVDHKQLDMVDVYSPQCESPGCVKQPNFNLETLQPGRFCATHKHPNMVDVTCRKCQHTGCKTKAYFTFEASHGGQFCSRHALTGMVNLNRPRCKQPGCVKIASFGLVGVSFTMFCGLHKQPEMVSRAAAARAAQNPGSAPGIP